MKGDARRIEAIPILVGKINANYSLLILLSEKYGLSGRLIGLLKALDKIKRRRLLLQFESSNR